jgi:hypothetical protein
MKQTFDTDTILYQILNSPTITGAISGKVYKRQRPLNSDKVDIVVNTIDLTQNYAPQIGASNINIHVPDQTISVNGVQQKFADEIKMKSVSALVLDLIRSTIVPGLSMTVEAQNIIQEVEINQHYVNIRISWNIHS